MVRCGFGCRFLSHGMEGGAFRSPGREEVLELEIDMDGEKIEA